MTVVETQMVEESLKNYHFEKTEISFIRHNENITCKITADGKPYVLRIHSPVDGFSLKLFQNESSEKLIRGETELLLHLSRTASFPVQRPVKNKLGEYITFLSGGVPAQLLQWVEGKTLLDQDISQYADELGKLAAQIHSASEGFAGQRISYSYDFVRRMKSEFATIGEKKHLTQKHVCACSDVLAEVERIMAELDEQPNSKSLIHADLSTENIIETPCGLAPIDFSLSGFGYRAQECGMVALNYENEEDQEVFRTSYEAASGVEIKRHHMKAFGIFSMLAYIAAQHNRYWTEPWFQEMIANNIDILFVEFLNE